LLSHGADPNAPVGKPKRQSMIEMIRAMLPLGPRPPLRDTVLLMAVGGKESWKPEAAIFVQRLLDSGASTSVKDRLGRSPLMLAALFAHSQCSQALIEHGVEVNERGPTGLTALGLIMLKANFVGAQPKEIEQFSIVRLLKRAGAT